MNLLYVEKHFTIEKKIDEDTRSGKNFMFLEKLTLILSLPSKTENETRKWGKSCMILD